LERKEPDVQAKQSSTTTASGSERSTISSSLRPQKMLATSVDARGFFRPKRSLFFGYTAVDSAMGETESQDNRVDRSHDGMSHAFWHGRVALGKIEHLFQAAWLAATRLRNRFARSPCRSRFIKSILATLRLVIEVPCASALTSGDASYATGSEARERLHGPLADICLWRRRCHALIEFLASQ
jgi:hypothetical protein